MSGANYGTSGQVLTSGGSGATPTWAATSGFTTVASGTTYTVAATNNHVYRWDDSDAAANMTMTLPAASSVPGVMFTFVTIDANYNNLYVQRAGSDLIYDDYDLENGTGAGLSLIGTAYDHFNLTLVSDGVSGWFTVHNYAGYWNEDP